MVEGGAKGKIRKGEEIHIPTTIKVDSTSNKLLFDDGTGEEIEYEPKFTWCKILIHSKTYTETLDGDDWWYDVTPSHQCIENGEFFLRDR